MLHQPTTTLPEPERLMKLREVKHIVSLATSSIYRMMDAGTFPRPVRLSPGCVRWRQSDLEKWLESLPQ